MDDSVLNERFAVIDGRFEKLEDLIRSEGASTRRHFDVLTAHFDVLATHFDVVATRFDVVAENMKGEIQLLAEGHAALVENMAEVKGGIKRLEVGQVSLVLRTSALESRLTNVEKTQKVMLTELRGLASRR